jgi:hypothetical protein
MSVVVTGATGQTLTTESHAGAAYELGGDDTPRGRLSRAACAALPGTAGLAQG